ncbi:MAG: hypothetical protein JWO88_2428 [Frankiales bacterium]|jgi:hypothetical protein|nr:hypothetical protein [Frankiales bacterium]
MTTPHVDAADPADLAEQHESATRDEARAPDIDVPLEAAEADVAEQAAAAGPGEHIAARDIPLEADELDAAEQAVVVEQDDEYR